MKQQDVAVVLIVVFIGGMLSFFLSGLLITSPKNRSEKVEVVKPITADFQTPDKRYFNELSINPTQLITIGDNNNNTPFNTQQ